MHFQDTSLALNATIWLAITCGGLVSQAKNHPDPINDSSRTSTRTVGPTSTRGKAWVIKALASSLGGGLGNFKKIDKSFLWDTPLNHSIHGSTCFLNTHVYNFCSQKKRMDFMFPFILGSSNKRCVNNIQVESGLRNVSPPSPLLVFTAFLHKACAKGDMSANLAQ